MVTESSCSEKALKTQNTWLTATGRSGWGGASCVCAGLQGAKALLTPQGWPWGLLRRSLARAQHCKAEAGTRSCCFMESAGCHCLFAFQAGMAPAVLQASPALPSSCPQPMLERGCGEVRSQLEVIPSIDSTATQSLCFAELVFFNHTLFVNLDCQTHLSRKRIPSGNRSLWKCPHIQKRHATFFWKASACH